MVEVRRDPTDLVVQDATQYLMKALRIRITQRARRLYPQAMTVQTGYNEYSHRDEVWRVCGPYGRVLFDRESDDRLIDVNHGDRWQDAQQVADDVELLIKMVDVKGTRHVRPLQGNREYSIHLGAEQ